MQMNARGFTLVEMSIVIIIIGLLAGAVVGGQSLIHSSRLKHFSAEIERDREAISGFGQQYNALPGDFNNGYAFWAADCASSADECNGDGNGRIGADGSFADETYRAWQHLALAKLLSGSYNGEAGSVVDLNIPRTVLEQSGLYLTYDILAAYDNMPVGNVIRATTPDGSETGGVMNAADAQSLDEKMDDGAPNSGRMYAYYGTASTDGAQCFTGTQTGGNVTYLLTAQNGMCVLAFSVQ